VVHVLVNLPWVGSRWGPVWPGFAFGDPRFRRVLIELGKVVAIGVFAQINIIVLRQIATSLEDGALTWYTYATRIVDLAQGVVAVGIGSALLPDVSRSVAEQAWDRFRDDIVGAVRLAGFLILPAAAVILGFAEPLTAMLFRHGAYSWEDVRWTAATLQLLIPFLFGLAGMQIFKKVYFALEDRKTLLAVGALGVVLTGGLGLLLVRPLGIAGLALALSLATMTQLALYLVVLWRRLGSTLGLDRLLRPLTRMALACVPITVVLMLAQPLGEWQLGPTHPMNFIVALTALLAAGLCYAGSAKALGIRELDQVLGRVFARWQR